MGKTYQRVRGMYDLLPERAAAFDMVVNTFRQVAGPAGFGWIVTPVLEDAAIYQRGVGAGTDIVDKELYTFKDRSDNELALRPEGTAGVVRAYIEHGMGSWPQPVKLHYVESIFRYDRPQEGRYRQHTQAGLELFGEAGASADAQVIILALRFLKRLGLRQTGLQVNSIGDANCRPQYQKALSEYLEAQGSQLCETCRKRAQHNPLRVLDCKEEGCRTVIAGAPQTLNYLCSECQTHFAGVLEYLDELGITYELNHLLVRGLDYYTRTVFEIYGTRAGAQATLVAGGRYDGLVERLGGAATPGVGFGSGIERLLLELEAEGVALAQPQSQYIFVASLGEPARLVAFKLIEQLLDADVPTVGAVDRGSIGSQLAKANRLGVKYAVIIGQKEVMEGTVILRDMTSGAQEMIPLTKLVGDLQKRFSLITKE